MNVALTRFTPSLMPRDLLERLFVAREPILEQITSRITAAIQTDERNHTLLVGPRGAGKTHIVALAYHRTRDLLNSGGQFRIAWLPEDPWGIGAYEHLLHSILANAEPPIPGESLKRNKELEGTIKRVADYGGLIVVFVENLDQVLATLGDVGQQRLRHLLQADGSILLVATTTSLTRELADQGSPFYGFFTTSRLKPFDVEQASLMLTRIADERADLVLSAYLTSDQGKARLRTVAHLAGGQPRIWATLASALTVGTLDDLVTTLITRFDDLTPYYQEQLARLSPQQRRIVMELAELDRPVNVGTLAGRLGIGERTLAKTISELKDRGWLAPTPSPLTLLLDQRRTYYELAEPLARLAFQIKASRGRPLRMVIDFLKLWFEPDIYSQSVFAGVAAQYWQAARDESAQDPVVEVTRLLQHLPAGGPSTLRVLAEVADGLSALAEGDPEPLLELPASLRAALEARLGDDPTDAAAITRLRVSVQGSAMGALLMDPVQMEREWVIRGRRLVTDSQLVLLPFTLSMLAAFLALDRQLDEAELVLEELLQLDSATKVPMVHAHWVLATAYRLAGQPSEELRHHERAVSVAKGAVETDSEHHLLLSRSALAFAYARHGRTAEATELAVQVVGDTERLAGADHPDTIEARARLVSSLFMNKQTDDAVTAQRRVIRDSERVFGAEHPETLSARSMLCALLLYSKQFDEALVSDLVHDAERVLGADHRITLSARSYQVLLLAAMGRAKEASVLANVVLADHERVLGNSDPYTLGARSAFVYAHELAGNTEVVARERRSLEFLEKDLGSDHLGLNALRAALGNAPRRKSTAEKGEE